MHLKKVVAEIENEGEYWRGDTRAWIANGKFYCEYLPKKGYSPSELIKGKETNGLKLEFSHGRGKRSLSFGKTELSPEQWRRECKQKLSGLLGLEHPSLARNVTELRTTTVGDVTIVALTMDINNEYDLQPASSVREGYH